MKYIVIGLGYFGTSLATKLTSLGHEVIGIDNRQERVEELKDRMAKVLVMDSTSQKAIESLPISDMDGIIVAIGEDIGSSVLTLFMLKKLNVKRLIGRAINPRHQNILSELGIEEIVHPEEDTATIVSSLLMVKNAVSILPLNDDYIIAEIVVPSKYVGHTIDTINLESRFDVKLVTVKIAPRERGLSTVLKKDFQIDKTCDRYRPLRENDRLILIGEIQG
ncbi:MAG: TrkA family potassium uptake protein [Bacteroidales bacterium]|nr:TrkA family potassium uptake protein [Bacteroidales bacterium]